MTGTCGGAKPLPSWPGSNINTPLITAKLLNQLRHFSTDEWMIKNVAYIHNGILSAIKKNEIGHFLNRAVLLRETVCDSVSCCDLHIMPGS
jgi:hypothetical protein